MVRANFPVLAAGHEPPHRWERNSLWLLLIVVLGLGVVIVDRTAFQQTKKGDATVYFRAGWAIRSGAPLYEVADDKGLHFAYPPVTAYLFVPFADAPPGLSRKGLLPLWASAALWHLVICGSFFLAIHWFATTLESTASDPNSHSPPVGCRRWWQNRVLPLLVCIVPIGDTLSHGQVASFILLFVAGMFRATVRGRSFRSGLWLAAAICLKVIPGLLLIFPILRRDTRALAGVAVGLVVGIAVIPTIFSGPQAAFEMNRQFVDGVIRPSFGMGGTSTLHDEMMSMKRPGSQSIKAVIHNYQNWDFETRPEEASSLTKGLHYAISAILIGGLVLAYGWRRQHDAIGTMIFVGGLLTVMILISPESHTHYFCIPMALIMALSGRSIERRPSHLLPSRPVLAVFVFVGICYAFTIIEVWTRRREVGIPFFASSILWCMAIIQLRREKHIEMDRPMDSNARVPA